MITAVRLTRAVYGCPCLMRAYVAPSAASMRRSAAASCPSMHLAYTCESTATLCPAHSATCVRPARKARPLRLPPGTPVIDLIRTTFDADGRAVEVMVSVMAADMASFAYEFAIPN